MEIIWSKPAREDLQLIYQYITHDSNYYAKQVVQDIAEKVGVLANLPKIGRKGPEINDENIREIGMYSYRIMYELINNTVYIHGIFHKRQHFKPEDLDEH